MLKGQCHEIFDLWVFLQSTPPKNYHRDIIGISTTAVSLTPLKQFPQCQWHRWNDFSGVNDSAETAMRIRSKVSAVSMKPLNFGKKKFCGWNPYDILNFTIMVVSVVSLKPLKLKQFPRCQWHRRNSYEDQVLSFRNLCDTTETEKRLCESLTSFKENIQQNYFMGKYPHTR
jgi:hypothetical protein